jgi:F-type H+-transporting ATPase subunit a
MIDILAAGMNPLEHVVDHKWFGGAFTILSNHVIMMILAAVLLLLLLPRLLRVPLSDDEVERLTPTGPRNALEGICTFFREFVVRPNLGRYTDTFIPYIWTVFFFILTCNLLGLLPLEAVTKTVFRMEHGIYGTATGNIWVTGALAAATILMTIYNGLRLHGMAYAKHFFIGPFPINILIAVLEVVGLLVKAFALAMRLFANMVAGHILMAVLIGFIGMAGAAGVALGLAIAVPVVLGSVAISLLELFVAFLQAFIFTFLSAVFLGLAVNIHHEHAGEEHAEIHEPSDAVTRAHRDAAEHEPVEALAGSYAATTAPPK